MDATIAPHNGSHYLGVDGELIKMFDPMPPPYPLAWLPNATFVQPDAEHALREKLSEYGHADVFLAASGGSFTQDDETVSLSVRSETRGEFTIKARYLVGCDGANSFVRKQLGIGLEDLAFDEWWMVVDTLTSEPDKRAGERLSILLAVAPRHFHPRSRPIAALGDQVAAGEDPEKAGAADNVLRLLKGFTDVSDLTIWRSAVYRFHALLGQSWRDGRVFLMGDAVHQTPPFLGQGLCAGIRDAANLAWKLAFVLRGDADHSLLDSYEVERKPHVRAVVASAKEFGTIIGELDPDAAAKRDARLRAELKSGRAVTIRQKFIPDLAHGLIAKDAKLAGRLFVQPRVRMADGQIKRLDDELKSEFAIVTPTKEALSGLSEAALYSWQKLGGERVVIAASGEGSNADGVLNVVEAERLFADWMRDGGVEAVIVRPDRYVFGGAVTASELNVLVADLVSKLRGGP